MWGFPQGSCREVSEEGQRPPPPTLALCFPSPWGGPSVLQGPAIRWGFYRPQWVRRMLAFSKSFKKHLLTACCGPVSFQEKNPLGALPRHLGSGLKYKQSSTPGNLNRREQLYWRKAQAVWRGGDTCSLLVPWSCTDLRLPLPQVFKWRWKPNTEQDCLRDLQP